MTKLLDNKYVMAGVSVILAIILTISVYSKNSVNSTRSGSTVSVNSSKDITDVPIYVKDSSNSIFVSGLPEGVSVYLEGPRNLLVQLDAKNVRVETEELADSPVGKKSIRLHAVGLPEAISARVEPQTLEATLEKRVSQEIIVTPIVPSKIIAEGYEMGEIVVTPAKVTITGPESTMDKVASVSVSLPEDKVYQETFELKDLAPVIKDEQGNILDVNVSHTVSVHVPVFKGVKNVPVTISLSGKNARYEYVVKSQTFDKIRLQGEQSVLDAIQSVSAIVDVTNVIGTKTLNATVVVPTGVSVIQQETLDVTVQVTVKEDHDDDHETTQTDSESTTR